MSTKPGVTSRPLASISSAPLPDTLPTAAILPSFTATSASRSAAPVPSATVPPRTTRSNSVAMFVSPGLSGVYLIVSGGRTPATCRRRPEIAPLDTRHQPHSLGGKRATGPPRGKGVGAVRDGREQHRRQAHDQDLQAMIARRIDELRKERAEEDQRLGVAECHQGALQQETAAWRRDGAVAADLRRSSGSSSSRARSDRRRPRDAASRTSGPSPRSAR